MKIKTIISQYRRDFKAIFICQHCDHEETKSGYDDSYFHNKVIPDMDCSKCKKKADGSYRPLSPKYPEGQQI